jgi:hypothetical protein
MLLVNTEKTPIKPTPDTPTVKAIAFERRKLAPSTTTWAPPIRALERRMRAKDIVIRGLKGLRAGGYERAVRCAKLQLELCSLAKVQK